jgi:hypothetical protein
MNKKKLKKANPEINVCGSYVLIGAVRVGWKSSSEAVSVTQMFRNDPAEFE